MKFCVALLAALLLRMVSTVAAAEIEHEKPRILPRDAAFLALHDVATVPEHIRPFIRYIWLPTAGVEAAQSLSYGVNEIVSRTSIVRPITITGGGYLMRLNFYELRGDLKSWEKLYPDLAFHLPVSAAGGAVASSVPVAGPRSKQFNGRWYRLQDTQPYVKAGVTYRAQWIPIEQGSRLATVRKLYFAPHALPHIQALADQVGTSTPIVSAGHFAARAAATIDYGFGDGLYYQFAGIAKSTDKKKTDQAFNLLKMGVDESELISRNLDRRALISVSGITDKKRAVSTLFGFNSPDNPAPTAITHDISNKSQRDPNKSAEINPLKFFDNNNDDAREIIGPNPWGNGFRWYMLTNNKGALQDEVPPDLAKWKGHAHATAQLVPGIACQECHSRANAQGWQPFKNEYLLWNRNGFRVVLDLSKPSSDFNERLIQEKYTSDLVNAVSISRRVYSDATFRATAYDGRPGASVEEAAQGFYRLFSGHAFGIVTPQAACEEMGLEVHSLAEAKAKIKGMLPAGEFVHPTLIALASGTSRTRVDWLAVYADAMAYAEKTYSIPTLENR